MEQMRISFFFILIVLSAAEDKKRNLALLQGGSVTFPDPVKEKGLLYFEGNTIAIVKEGQFDIWNKIYKGRLFWKKSTGLFTLGELQRNDSGIFKIESEDGKHVITYHELTVYEPVSAPEVTKLNVSTESCTLLCEVQKANETTLFWYRNTETVNQSSWALSLPLTVEDFTASYRCVAENPADNKTFHVNAWTLCERSDPKNPTDNHIRSYMIVVPIVIAAVVIVAMLAVRCLYFKQKATGETQGSEHRDYDVVYTDIHIPEDRRRPERNQPDSPGADQGSSLTTVYDKLQAHRITPTQTEACLYSQATNSSHA